MGRITKDWTRGRGSLGPEAADVAGLARGTAVPGTLGRVGPMERDGDRGCGCLVGVPGLEA